MEPESPIQNVFVTGATGFVGQAVVRELISRGLKPICLVRSAARLESALADIDPERFSTVIGDLGDDKALRQGAELSQATIHLVGIIIARRLQGQTFARIHVRGTERVVEAVKEAKGSRYVHMSALGTRPQAESLYHRTKWEAEEIVRASGLDWTIFRPSLIHGPRGEFMQLIKSFVCKAGPPAPPFIPYFGDGHAKLQPVSVKDVAFCMVEALNTPESIHQAVELAGPKAYSWVELYNTCRAIMPGAKHWKPLVSVPVPVAKMAAFASAPPMALAELLLPSLGKFRFDVGQVQMSQENSVCDHGAAEKMFGMKMRDFEQEVSLYADLVS